MSEEKDNEKGRSVRFHPAIWDALDLDAKRCRRSAVKQLEAILIAYYELGDVELDSAQMEETRKKIGTQTENIAPMAKKSEKGRPAKARLLVGPIKKPLKG